MCCFFKQKTAYEMRISDWSSDVCSSDLLDHGIVDAAASQGGHQVLDGADADPVVIADERAELGVGHPVPDRRDRPSASGDVDADEGDPRVHEIGRASCRERVCQYG